MSTTTKSLTLEVPEEIVQRLPEMLRRWNTAPENTVGAWSEKDMLLTMLTFGQRRMGEILDIINPMPADEGLHGVSKGDLAKAARDAQRAFIREERAKLKDAETHPTVSKHLRQVLKRGVRCNGRWFTHPMLGHFIGKIVEVVPHGILAEAEIYRTDGVTFICRATQESASS